jgi:uncharacterized oligopeptide transporter (OPT) family protein
MGPDYTSVTVDGPSENTTLLGGVSLVSSSTDAYWKPLSPHERLKDTLTLRGTLAGLAVGVLICLSNVYFGLQTGGVNGMSLPSAVLGFSIFKSVSKYLAHPLTAAENVFVETVAGAVGCMPLGAGLITVIPALQHLLKPHENGPLNMTWAQLLFWATGVCFFGLIFAMPLREQFVVREKLPFPSSTATAIVIKTLHEKKDVNSGTFATSELASGDESASHEVGLTLL